MYIVTGGAGFIGSAMIWKLNQMGIDDILVVDNLAATDKWKNLVNLRYTDYLHRDRFLKMVAGDSDPFDVAGIVHMGACSSTTERDADFLMENNTRYTQVLCRYALKNDVRFLNASSVMGIPCVTVRPNTERPITCLIGTNVLCPEPGDIPAAVAERLASRGSAHRDIPFWDGAAGRRSADAIERFLQGGRS